MKHINKHFNLGSILTVNEYINIGSTLQIADRLNNDEIIALVNGEEVVEECSNSKVEQIILVMDTIKSINMLTTFSNKELE